MAHRQAVQTTPVTKWQPKETVSNEDDQQLLAIMIEMLQGKKVINRDFETIIEEFEKRIKLILQPGEMKARFEHFQKEAKNKLHSLPPQKLLIKVKRNKHPPYLSEALE